MRFFFVLVLALVVSGKGYTEQNNSLPPQNLVFKSIYGAGFFAEVSMVLDGILHFYQDNLKSVYVDWSQEFFPYKDDPYENGWDRFFEPVVFPHDSSDTREEITHVVGTFYHEIHDFLCIDHWVNYDQYLPYRLRVHEIIKKHLKIKEPILDKVDTIVSEKMAGYTCIGVHVRYGSDHGSEAPKGVPTLADYVREVKKLVKAYDKNRVRIYLATDSRYVVQEFQKVFPADMLLTIDTFRTEYRDVPHLIYGNGDYWLEHKEEFHAKKPGYLGGEGVLMDALLLANCEVLVHTTSNIAAFVSFYNPYIRSIYLPKDQRTWPCRHGLNY